MKKCLSTIALLTALPVIADQPLTKDEISKLIVGNTIEVLSTEKQETLHVFHSADGLALARKSDGQQSTGTWRFVGADQHCTKWGKKAETCGQILPSGNNGYRRVVDGKTRAEWKSIVPGKGI